DAIEALDQKVDELEGRLEGDIRPRYEVISGRSDRVVAPVLNGICYSCFVAISTARASVSDRNRRVESCEHCGCFLYHVD
ncbi:MAG: hypothetical protein R3266_06630, partial [Gemmatimonadota bacterium]|nr:hypothetical protein [Gemmatimonadota bacterium]